jgi:[ribosomal protein S18]-alanine N-acetyltransferase
MIGTTNTTTPFRPSPLTVRGVGPFDLGRMARLHRSCFEEAWSRSDLAHLLAMPGGFGLIARLYEGGLSGLDGLRGVGFAICRVAADESELLTIGVAPQYRRRGVAAALLRAGMERCLRVGAKSMFLEVAVDNHPAQQLYEEHGFERVGLRPDYYQRANGARASAYTMRCDLARQLEESDAGATATDGGAGLVMGGLRARAHG